MQIKWIITACVLIFPTLCKAATITAMLVDLNSGAFSPGVHTIQVQLKSDQPFGISGVGFNVISVGTNNAAFPGGVSNSSFDPTVIAAGFGTVQPLALDATTYLNYRPQPSGIPLSDGDPDAIGGSIYAVPGTVNPQLNGIGRNNAFQVVATERWTYTGTETLKLFLVGPQYFTDASGSSFADFDTVDASRALLTQPLEPGPEPTSMILIALGGLNLIAIRKRVGCQRGCQRPDA